MYSKYLYFSLALLCVAIAAPCTQQYECVQNGATTDYNYASCTNGQCVCRTSNGFIGNGSAADPCRCPSPSNVYWGNGQPFCKSCPAPAQIIYDNNGNPKCIDTEACDRDLSRNAQQEAVVRKVYTNLIGTTPTAIIANPALVSDIFASNISGRITPVGVFSDLEGTVEYFYAFAVGNKVKQVNFIDLISEGNTVAVRVDILFNVTDVSGNYVYNLTQTGFFHFNSEGRIFLYDLTILRLGQIVDNITRNHPLYINQICQVHQIYCTGPNQQFVDQPACVNFLTNSIPFGTFHNAQSNTVACRIIHIALVPFRPAIHCAHIGPTGGGKCYDKSYDSFYQEPFY